MVCIDRLDGRVRIALTDGDLLTVAYVDPSEAIDVADRLRAAGEEILHERCNVPGCRLTEHDDWIEHAIAEQ